MTNDSKNPPFRNALRMCHLLLLPVLVLVGMAFPRWFLTEPQILREVMWGGIALGAVLSLWWCVRLLGGESLLGFRLQGKHIALQAAVLLMIGSSLTGGCMLVASRAVPGLLHRFAPKHEVSIQATVDVRERVRTGVMMRGSDKCVTLHGQQLFRGSYKLCQVPTVIWLNMVPGNSVTLKGQQSEYGLKVRDITLGKTK